MMRGNEEAHPGSCGHPEATIPSPDVHRSFLKVNVAQSHPTLRHHGLYSPRDSPGQNTGVGSHYLLQGIFPTQGLNPGLHNYRRNLYSLSHQGGSDITQFSPESYSGISMVSLFLGSLEIVINDNQPNMKPIQYHLCRSQILKCL